MDEDKPDDDSPDETAEDAITYEPARQVWVLQYRSRRPYQVRWRDLHEIEEKPLENKRNMEKADPSVEWRIIRRTDEVVIFNDGTAGDSGT